ncbi:MAG: aminotransferase class V-fold PLP-dependent enzyme, partial [Gemmatimonadetes bacterium]|nr:aminotransferase class V-fold PLP-dependent enzyme [Gemmatimonadota bacterium]
MDIREARALFPGASEQVYLDVSVRGLLPLPAQEAIQRHLDSRIMGTGTKEEVHARIEAVRERFAHMIGASHDEIAITKNVSEGLNLFASSLPWETGDN